MTHGGDNAQRRFSRTDPGGKHFHSHWLAVANDAASGPLWFRIMALAYGSHRANGHAHFGPGWITGWATCSPSHLDKAIKNAISRNVLSPLSNARCLVVPDGVAGGLGSPYDRCPDYQHRNEPGGPKNTN